MVKIFTQPRSHPRFPLINQKKKKKKPQYDCINYLKLDNVNYKNYYKKIFNYLVRK